MALRFAILTALAERSSTGLQLARRFDRSIGYFWSASHQQIYRELDRLDADGLVREGPTPQRPQRGQPRSYEITSDGRVALREWVAQVDAPSPLRESLMVRLRAAAALGDVTVVRDAVAGHLAAHEEYLQTYEAIGQRDFAGPPAATPDLQQLVLQCGIDLERAWIDWCRTTLAQLDDRT